MRAYRKSLEPQRVKPWEVTSPRRDSFGHERDASLFFFGRPTTISGPEAALAQIARLLNDNIEEGSER